MQISLSYIKNNLVLLLLLTAVVVLSRMNQAPEVQAAPTNRVLVSFEIEACESREETLEFASTYESCSAVENTAELVCEGRELPPLLSLPQHSCQALLPVFLQHVNLQHLVLTDLSTLETHHKQPSQLPTHPQFFQDKVILFRDDWQPPLLLEEPQERPLVSIATPPNHISPPQTPPPRQTT